MEILLVGNYGPDRQKSMNAYADLLERSFSDAREIRIVRAEPRPILLRGNAAAARGWRKWLGYVDKYLLFPWRLLWLARRAQLVHVGDHSNAVYCLLFAPSRCIVTCHDVLAIEAAQGQIKGWGRTGFTGRLLQAAILRGLKRAAVVACSSHYTREHLVALGRNPQNVAVVHLCLNGDFAPAAPAAVARVRARIGLLEDSLYLLHVGSDLPRKNRLFTLKVLLHMDKLQPERRLKLVLLGPPLNPAQACFASENGLADRVTCVQDASHAELNALYTGAAALLFPSTEEGFGWPVLEAQACGCPVIASALAPMTEVAGKSAIFVDPNDAESAARVGLQALVNRTAWVEKGFANVRRFSFEAHRNKWLAAYRLARSL
jgi:glycosyltransferase involved in cell wall biosynthesis